MTKLHDRRDDGESAREGVHAIEDLAQLRLTIETWVERAAEAVLDFRRPDGSFWTNSKAANKGPPSSPAHITTTARCYIALQYAHRALGKIEKREKESKGWVESFSQFVGQPSDNQPLIKWTDGENSRVLFYETRKEAKSVYKEKNSQSKDGTEGNKQTPPEKAIPDVNTFDVAHLADYVQVAEYIERFSLSGIPADGLQLAFASADGIGGSSATGQRTSSGESGNVGENAGAQAHTGGEAKGVKAGMEAPPQSEGNSQCKALREAVSSRLNYEIENATVATDSVPNTGEVKFDDGDESAHYFATLHALRALHALGEPLPSNVPKVVEGARAFAVEQCYYSQRGAAHRQDPLRLVFAGSIYAIYGEHVDKDLCLAIVEALHRSQMENGSWPATHPIHRKNSRPWHIASHEVALCLTWLYFQPKVPDSARPLLIAMMRKYLLNAIAPTFFRAPNKASGLEKRQYDGWQDDHTFGTETTVGWATAIVCHFLANFSLVIDDWINRRVIEDLNLELATEDYLIDDVVGKPARRWQRDLGKPVGRQVKSEGGQSTEIVARETGEVWPDLPPHGWDRQKANSEALAAEIYESWTDPSEGNMISHGIAKIALRPIFAEADQRPTKGDGYAGLIPGQPGTRKTTLVNHIARVSMWPKVAVPASLIFARGFDNMEAQANYVFDRLNRLRRCVIFFDEFEEFFVSRKPEEGVESSDKTYKLRTIAAFTTSAMLPRLQDLHDVRRCLIFLATNHLDKMDSAIKRRGRFDFQIEVNHPTAKRLVEYLADKAAAMGNPSPEESEGTKKRRKVLKAIQEAVASLSRINPELQIRFAWIEGLFRKDYDLPDADLDSAVYEELSKLISATQPDDPPQIESLLADTVPQ